MSFISCYHLQKGQFRDIWVKSQFNVTTFSNQGVIPTVPDQKTEETQSYAPKREQAPKRGSNEEGKKKNI
jgi:hypothetical protein